MTTNEFYSGKGKTMTNHTDTLQALVAAGDDATQGKTVKALVYKNHWEVVVCREKGFPFLLADDCSEENADFIDKAANARPALKALLDELRELRGIVNNVEADPAAFVPYEGWMWVARSNGSTEHVKTAQTLAKELDELKEKDRVMGVMAEALRWSEGFDDAAIMDGSPIYKMKQALAQFEKIKGQDDDQ